MNRLLTVGCVGLVFACASMGGLAEETGVVTSRTAIAVGQEASSSVLDGVFTPVSYTHLTLPTIYSV